MTEQKRAVSPYEQSEDGRGLKNNNEVKNANQDISKSLSLVTENTIYLACKW
jgi:hypothetical protein